MYELTSELNTPQSVDGRLLGIPIQIFIRLSRDGDSFQNARIVPQTVFAVGVLTVLYQRGLAWASAPFVPVVTHSCAQAAGTVRVTSLPSTRNGRPRSFLR